MLTETKYGYIIDTDYENIKEDDIPDYIKERTNLIAENYFDNKKQAIKESEKLVEDYPNEYQAYIHLIFTYLYHEMDDKIKELYKSMFKKFSDKLEVKLNYLDDLADEKDFDQIKEICQGEPTIDNIVGEKRTLNIIDFEQITEILVKYYMETGNKEKADDYYNELKNLDGDYSSLRHLYYPEFIDTLKEGDSVKIKADYIDEETKINMSGWQGRILEIQLDEEIMLIEWDSLTLETIRAEYPEYIELNEEEEESWDTHYVSPDDIEVCEPRDTEEDVANTFEKIMDEFYDEYKVEGFPYERYEDIKTLNARNGRVFTQIMSEIQARRKTFDKINLNKLAEELELSVSDLLKAIDELENNDHFKTYYSSVLKKDRERWIFLKTDENYALYEKLKNKEITAKQLESM